MTSPRIGGNPVIPAGSKMLEYLLIILVVIVLCSAFAYGGTVLGARYEESARGAGIVESDMRTGLSASGVGAMIGIIPFLVFIGILVFFVVTSPAHHDDGTGGSTTSAEH